MGQHVVTGGEVEMPRHRASADQGGFVLPWFALLLLVMIAMAGFGVDVWNWWYTAQKTQRAADAGALAGVVFMPGDPTSANSTALFAVSNNGYPSSAASVGVPAGGKPNQLQVTVSQTVNNSFTSLLGVATTTISRSATAEFNEPVKMGSPQAHIANDPDNSYPSLPVDQHWLNIGAPGVDKHTGDRYADYQCVSSYLCDGSNKNSQEYLGTSYVFTVDVPAGSPDIDIQAYDPEYANGGTTCDNGSSGTSNWSNMTAANIQALQRSNPGQFPAGQKTVDRYAQGANSFCTGDDNTNLGTPQATAWIVRGPTVLGNPFQALTNDVLPSKDIPGASGPGSSNSCTKQFTGYNSDFLALLNPAGGDPDFLASFHQWYTLCHISGAAPGKYFVQVRSAVPLQGTPSIANLTKSEDPKPENQSLAGQNRYSLRVVNHLTNTYTPNVNVYAETHLPIYSNVLNNANQTPQFYLARLLPGGGASGRVLQLRFYDIGDVGGGTTTITITPPSEMTGKKPVCTWTANGGKAFPTEGTRNGCAVSGITQSDYPAGYNGTLIEANIQVFGDYNCANGDPARNPLGCWFKIQMSYTNGTQANDTTTWDANIGGDPVRLIK